MTTAATTLDARVRDLLDDYGDAVLTITAAISDTSGTSITLSETDAVEEEDWLSVDFETLYVSAVPSGPPYTTTVRRGQRGSTAATHSNGAAVIVNPLYPSSRILVALNGALSKLQKTISDASTLTVTDDVYVYTVPTTIDNVKRVEIENSDETGQFYISRNWEMYSATQFRIFGEYDTTRNIMVIGTTKFTPLTATGNLDSAFPDDNEAALNYLCYEAAGQLLLQRQAKIASRDGFVGMTDAFAQSQPDQSVRTARQYLAEAERYRQMAIKQEPILQTPVGPTQDPGRIYLMRV